MMRDIDTIKECPACHVDLDDSSAQFPRGTRRISVYDRNLDCTVAYRCPDCRYQWDRALGEIIAVQEIT
jgi:hypothetical protein